MLLLGTHKRRALAGRAERSLWVARSGKIRRGATCHGHFWGPQVRQCLRPTEAQGIHCSCHCGGSGEGAPSLLGDTSSSTLCLRSGLSVLCSGQFWLLLFKQSQRGAVPTNAPWWSAFPGSSVLFGDSPGAGQGKLSRVPAESGWIPATAQEQGPDDDYILSSHGLEPDSSPQGPRLKSQFLAASSCLQAHPVEEESIQEDLSYSSILTAFLPHVGKTGEEAFGPACWKGEACNVGRKRGALNPST